MCQHASERLENDLPYRLYFYRALLRLVPPQSVTLQRSISSSCGFLLLEMPKTVTINRWTSKKADCSSRCPDLAVNFSPSYTAVMRATPLFALLSALVLISTVGLCAAITSSESTAVLELLSQFPVLAVASMSRSPMNVWNSSLLNQLCTSGGPTFYGIGCVGTAIGSVTMYAFSPFAMSTSITFPADSHVL